MAESQGPIAIMFADMTGSTRLYDDLGNTAAIDVVSICLQALIKVVEQFRGTVIKTIGISITRVKRKLVTLPTLTTNSKAH